MIFYTLWYNKTLVHNDVFEVMKPWSKNADLIRLQESIDNAILRQLHESSDNENGESPRIKSSYSDYPEPKDRDFQGFDIMTMQGPYYFVLGPLLMFMFVVQQLASEKANRLRNGLTVVGVSHSAYLLSWFIVLTLLNIIQSTVLLISGYIMNFSMWWHMPASMIFWLHFLSCQGMIVWAFVVTALFDRLETATMSTYVVILVDILIGFCFN